MNDITLRRRVRHAAEVHGVSPKAVVESVVTGDSPEYIEHPPAAPIVMEQEKNRHLGAWITSIVVFAFFGSGIWWLIHTADSAATSGQTNLAEQRASVAPKPTQPNSLSGQNFTLQYPAIYDQVGQMKTATGIIEQYSMTARSDTRREVIVSVDTLSSDGLDYDAGYRYRSLTPALYKGYQVTVAGSPATIWKKVDGSEQTLYWPHGGKLIVVSMTFSGGSSALSSDMDLVVKTLKARG